MLLASGVLLLSVIAEATVCERGAAQAAVAPGPGEDDLGSLLQRGTQSPRLNVSAWARAASKPRNLMLLQRGRADKPEKQFGRPKSKHCGPVGLTAATLSFYALVLLASAWAACCSASPGPGDEGAAPGLGTRLVQSCVWQLLTGLSAVYLAKDGSLEMAALLTCLVCSVASLGACRAELLLAQGHKEASERLLSTRLRGCTVPHALWMCCFQVAIVSTLAFKGPAGLELAWILSLLAMLLASYLGYVQLFLRSQAAVSYWVLIACSTSLLVILAVSYTQIAGKGEGTCIEEWEAFLALRFNRAAAFGGAFFICILYLFYEFVPGAAIRRISFLGVLILLLTPGASAITGRDLLYGPWGMFGGDLDDTKLTPLGYAVLTVAAPVAVWMCVSGHPEILGMGWDRVGPSATLALIRILLVYWLVVNPDWGGATPIMLWYAPDQWPGGLAMKAVLVLSMACMAVGLWAAPASAVMAAGFCLGCTRQNFDPDCPTQHIAMVLVILAFTPCDECYSLKSALLRWMPGWAARSPGQAAGSKSTLWALSFLRLQMSLLYFWAGEFKARVSWLDGTTLYKDIEILDTSPISGFWYTIFWTASLRRSFTTVLACSALAMELTLPFLLWSKSLHVYAVALAALMHLAMSLLAGQLGGFTQICWITLLGSLQDQRVEELLQQPRNFWMAVLGGIALMACIGDAFEIHGEPFGTNDPGQVGNDRG